MSSMFIETNYDAVSLSQHYHYHYDAVSLNQQYNVNGSNLLPILLTHI